MNNLFSIFTIAKKEILDNTRNINIIIVTIIFAIITIFVSFFGSINGGSWNDMESTVQWMMFFIQFLVPIIGLMLGYASIIGEIERGTMSALLSEPTTRLEIILGKFIGLSLVLATSIFIGLITAGLIISMNVSGFDFGKYIMFIFFTILLGIIFISISMFFSSILKRRTQAIGFSIFVWGFFSFLWGILLFALIGMSRTDISNSNESGGFFLINLLSPTQDFLCLISVNMGTSDVIMPSLGMSVFAHYFPDYYNTGVFLLLLLLWIIIPLILAYISFNQKDI